MTSKRKAASPRAGTHMEDAASKSQFKDTQLTPEHQVQINKKPDQAGGHNSAASQHQRILQHLKSHGSLSTFEGRRELDIPHVAARVMELRQRKHSIETVWVSELSQANQPHRIARYILRDPLQHPLFDFPGVSVKMNSRAQRERKQ